MPSDFPLFRALAALCVFMVVVGTGGSWLTGRGLPWNQYEESPTPRRAQAAAPVVAALPNRPAADSSLCRVDAAGIALPETVHESSGVAVGAGVLWTHNDSGEPRLFALGTDGAQRGSVRVTGAAVQDWEDLAAGPCPGGRCLFVGDVGDNQAARPRITIYRVPQPAPGDAATRPAEAFHATYPDGPQDAEAIFVTPDGRVYVVSKGETGAVAVYRFPEPMTAGSVARLERLRQLAPAGIKRGDRITGASASADGRWVVLRTLRALSFYRARDLAAAGGGAPLGFDLKALDEAQGEAVAFGEGGVVYLTSEGGKKSNPAKLSRLTCNLPA